MNGGTKPDRLVRNNGVDGKAADAELVADVRRGDRRAFVEIVARYQATVCGVALAILGDMAASEDAGQEAFLTAWRKFDELRDPERLRGWLVQIARNAAVSQLRRQRAEHPLDSCPDLLDASPRPDERAASDDDAAIVRESLAKLPETYRLPLILFYREGQSVRAVAEALDLSEDAVKQRLARGREMLRDDICGRIETVLTRTGPTAIFTMTIAIAIGALGAPVAIAGSIFAAVPTHGSTTAAVGSSHPLLATMSTLKGSLIATALVALICLPAGYHFASNVRLPAPRKVIEPMVAERVASVEQGAARFLDSVLFAEWQALHDQHGTNAQAMPRLYKAIAGLKDPFRRRAFRSALIAEWVQVDPAGGLAFFTGKGPDQSQRRQFLEEWLAQDGSAAVNALLASKPGWEEMARACLPEIARRLPARLVEIASRLPKPEDFWDENVRNAFAILAEGNLTQARQAAERVTGASREGALSGIARAWGRTDFERAIEWIRRLPEGADRDEVMRAAILGQATTDPAGALDHVGLVPAGGRHAYANSTTGARVLAEAAKTDFDGTVSWLAAHPGRFGREELMGLSEVVTEKLNKDPEGFLHDYEAPASLGALLSSIESALLNGAGSKKNVVWEWLQTHPENDVTRQLKLQVLHFAGYQDPMLAVRLAAELPQSPDGDAALRSTAQSVWNGGRMLHRFDTIFEEAPERLRQPLLETAFDFLNGDSLGDPKIWNARLGLLAEASRGRAAESFARAWAEGQPAEAAAWVNSLPPGEIRGHAVSGIAAGWSNRDPEGAAEWVSGFAPGVERDRAAAGLAVSLAERFPRVAWDWAVTVQDQAQQLDAAARVVKAMASRDKSLTRQWIDQSPLPAQAKTKLQAQVQRGGAL